MSKSQPCVLLGREKRVQAQSPGLLDCVSGVCIVRRDVITMICQTPLQTPATERSFSSPCTAVLW